MGKKIITVFGATGMQGGSVALTFLTDPKLKSEWSVRAITRDTKKPASKNLAKLGAELVTVSLASFFIEGFTWLTRHNIIGGFE